MLVQTILLGSNRKTFFLAEHTVSMWGVACTVELWRPSIGTATATPTEVSRWGGAGTGTTSVTEISCSESIPSPRNGKTSSIGVACTSMGGGRSEGQSIVSSMEERSISSAGVVMIRIRMGRIAC